MVLFISWLFLGFFGTVLLNALLYYKTGKDEDSSNSLIWFLILGGYVTLFISLVLLIFTLICVYKENYKDDK